MSIETHPIGWPIDQITMATWWPGLDFEFEPFVGNELPSLNYVVTNTNIYGTVSLSLDSISFSLDTQQVYLDHRVIIGSLGFNLYPQNISLLTYRNTAEFSTEMIDSRSGMSSRGQTQYIRLDLIDSPIYLAHREMPVSLKYVQEPDEILRAN